MITGFLSYDPAFMNTAACRSAITFIDGDKGILRYRGYPIEQLAEKASFLEVAWLLRHGELPTQTQYDDFVHDITYHTYVHENIKTFLEGFRYDAHPMSMLCSAVAALSSFYPESKNIFDPVRAQHLDHPAAREGADDRGVHLPAHEGSAVRLSGQRALVRRELPVDGRPDERASVPVEPGVHPGDRESSSSCTPTTSRTARPTRCAAVGSSHVDPYSAVAAGIAALYGPLHGGANEAVLRMIEEIGDKSRVPAFIEGVKKRIGAPHGIRAPGLQELRPACQDREAAGVRGLRVRGHGPGPGDRARAGADRARRTTTSSRASCIPTWTSTRDSSTGR